MADVCDLMRDDQMVLGVDNRLHVIAEPTMPVPLPLVAMARASGSVNET